MAPSFCQRLLRIAPAILARVDVTGVKTASRIALQIALQIALHIALRIALRIASVFAPPEFRRRFGLSYPDNDAGVRVTRLCWNVCRRLVFCDRSDIGSVAIDIDLKHLANEFADDRSTIKYIKMIQHRISQYLPMFVTVKKIVGLSAALILVAAWYYSGFLENTYVNYPRSPNVGEGLTVPFVVKGIVVYITERQRLFLSWLNWVEIGSGAIVVLVILIHGGDPFKTRNCDDREK